MKKKDLKSKPSKLSKIPKIDILEIETPKKEKVKKEKAKKPHYVDPIEFSTLITDSYKDGVITTELAECVLKIATRLSYAPNFINYCVDSETEAYTDSGWLNYKEIHINDKILSYDIKDKKLKWSNVLDIYVNKNYIGKMHKIKGKKLDALVTPNHKFVIKDKGLVSIENITENDSILIQATDITTQIDTHDIIDYDGVVWCPSTDYGTFVCRRNGSVYITGNSYRDEMIGDAIVKMLHAIKNKKFDPMLGNAFSYFTRIAFNAFCNRIKKEKKEKEFILNLQDNVYDDMIGAGFIETKHSSDEDQNYHYE